MTLSLLSDFEDNIVIETVNSWKFDSFDKTPFIIRGLLINAIKRMKIHKNENKRNFSNNDCDLSSELQQMCIVIVLTILN